MARVANVIIKCLHSSVNFRRVNMASLSSDLNSGCALIAALQSLRILVDPPFEQVAKFSVRRSQ